MLKNTVDLGNETTLVSNSGIQFMDFSFTLDSDNRIDEYFLERMESTTEVESAELAAVLRRLQPDPESGNMLDVESREVIDIDSPKPIYSIGFSEALKIFDRVWLPFPYLKRRDPNTRGSERFEKGPTVWSRMRIVKLTSDKDQNDPEYRLIIAFDTRPIERTANTPYTLPFWEDIKNETKFEFAYRFDEISWFIGEPWARGWLQTAYQEAIASKGIDEIYRQDENLSVCAFWAFYAVLLQGIHAHVKMPYVHFLDTISKPLSHQPIDMSLVLDIGNNRTCGVLVENNRNVNLDLRSTSCLELRDLSEPHLAYQDAFQSLVEFSELKFGYENWAVKAGIRDSFLWPSPIRVGPEANRLSGKSHGVEGNTGLSAPKRYLWDENEADQQWYFNSSEHKAREQRIVGGLFMAKITPDGNRLSRMDPDATVAIQARFSKASLFTFMVMEIILHALRQVNEPGYRAQCETPKVPRHLSKIIITVPSATPIVEKKLFQKRAQDAIKLIWEIMRWNIDGAHQFAEPELKIAYDEASCTQLVYLYAEIVQKLKRTPNEFFNLKTIGHGADNSYDKLRIASIDIGGGTTDLMIATYYTEANLPSRIELQQNFREGFRCAGDDIVAQVITEHILYQIIKSLNELGVSDSSALLRELLSDVGTNAMERHQRKIFITQVLLPIAYGILSSYENHQSFDNAIDPLYLHKVFVDPDDMPAPELIEYLDQALARKGITGFKLEDINFPVDTQRLAKTITKVMGNNLKALTDVISAFSCDYLLLTGRPSRLPIVKDLILQGLPVPPHRIVPMHDYSVGDWYPFAVKGNLIGDPKTTVAVGALICSLAEAATLESFHLPQGAFSLISTANYIGVIRPDGSMASSDILFSRDAKGSLGQNSSKAHNFTGATRLGFRQLDDEHWTATPLYTLQLPETQGANGSPKGLPWKVSFKRDNRLINQGNVREEDESISIAKIVNNANQEVMPPKSKLRLKLQTLPDKSGYWLDTGKIEVPDL